MDLAGGEILPADSVGGLVCEAGLGGEAGRRHHRNRDRRRDARQTRRRQWLDPALAAVSRMRIRRQRRRPNAEPARLPCPAVMRVSISDPTMPTASAIRGTGSASAGRTERGLGLANATTPGRDRSRYAPCARSGPAAEHGLHHGSAARYPPYSAAVGCAARFAAHAAPWRPVRSPIAVHGSR